MNWTKKAEQALRSGQPRLAELYMRRALSESPEGRAWLARRDLLAALEAVGVELLAWQWRVLEALGFGTEPTRADVALAGPSRG